MSPIVDFNPVEPRGYHGRWILGGPHHAHIRRDLRRAGGRRIAAPKGAAGVRADATRASVAAKAGTRARAADPWAGKGVPATSQDWGSHFDQGAAEDRAIEEAGRGGGRGGRGSGGGAGGRGESGKGTSSSKDKAKKKNDRNKRGGRGGRGGGLGNALQGLGGLAQLASAFRGGGHGKAAAAKAKAKAKVKAKVKAKAKKAVKKPAAKKPAVRKTPVRKTAVIKPPKAPTGRAPSGRATGRGVAQKVTPSAAVLANLQRYVSTP